MRKHYLITRFSINQRGWVARPTDDWLEHRWPLFERCAESVEEAEGKFKWLLLCSRGMGRPWFERLKEIDATIILVGENWLRKLQDYLNSGKDRSIITTRLDSDDLIGPHLMKKVQLADSVAVKYFVDVPHGYKEVDGVSHHYTEQNNPFLSYVETEGPFRSVYHVEHGSRINKHMVVRLKGRHWTQVIHDRNQRNKA